jgi:hypothetical protein
VRLTGPRADLPPCPGQIVRAQHTERQSTFIVRLPSQAVPSAVAPGWSSGPVTLEQPTITYLKTSAKPPGPWRPPYERTEHTRFYHPCGVSRPGTRRRAPDRPDLAHLASTPPSHHRGPGSRRRGHRFHALRRRAHRHDQPRVQKHGLPARLGPGRAPHRPLRTHQSVDLPHHHRDVPAVADRRVNGHTSPRLCALYIVTPAQWPTAAEGCLHAGLTNAACCCRRGLRVLMGFGQARAPGRWNVYGWARENRARRSARAGGRG